MNTRRLCSLLFVLAWLSLAGCDAVVPPNGVTGVRPAPASTAPNPILTDGSTPAPGSPPGGAIAGGSGETYLYDFQAEWCGPCKRMDPVVQSLARRGYPVRQVDVDANPELAQRYRVRGIPCFVMVVDGREVDRAVGVVPLSRLEKMFTNNQVAPIP